MAKALAAGRSAPHPSLQRIQPAPAGASPKRKIPGGFGGQSHPIPETLNRTEFYVSVFQGELHFTVPPVVKGAVAKTIAPPIATSTITRNNSEGSDHGRWLAGVFSFILTGFSAVALSPLSAKARLIRLASSAFAFARPLPNQISRYHTNPLRDG